MEFIVLLLALAFVMSTVVIFSLLRVMRPPLIDAFGDFGCQFQLRFFFPLFFNAFAKSVPVSSIGTSGFRPF